MLYLTATQQQEALRRLLILGRSHTDRIPFHSSGVEYTSLMICFLLHELSAARTLLRTCGSFGEQWFPVAIGYSIARTMFETDVAAHYITIAPAERARQYIEFGAVLNKHKMDACLKHRESMKPDWREATSLLWRQHWAPREAAVVNAFNAVAAKFTRTNRDGKEITFRNWSGKDIRQMAVEVDHVEAYDIFYSELSSFTHSDVDLANRYLRLRHDGPGWSQRAEEGDVGNVFRHAASFLTCYLELFGRQFNVWSDVDVQECWAVTTLTE